MTPSGGPLTGTTVGRYRLGTLLGRGGMGEVYRADDSELRRPVALKVLPEALVGDPDRLQRFVQEARTASALNHPHLVAIYAASCSRRGSTDRRATAMAVRSTSSRTRQVGVLTTETGTPVKVFPNLATTSLGGSTDWMPDGLAVLYTTTERFNVWRRRVEGGEPERVTNFSDLALVRFAISPDGRSLVMCRGTQVRDAFLITGFR